MKTHIHKKYQPVIYHGIPNLPYSEDPSSEYYQWWGEQFNRCINGYKPDSYAWIPGRLYFHLNFCKIKMAGDDTGREVISHPYYRDLEHELAQEGLDRAKAEHKGLIVPKARERGITYDMIGMVLLYETTFFEGTEVGLGTALPKWMEKPKIVLAEMYHRLPNELRSGFIHTNKDLWKFGQVIQETRPDGSKLPPKEDGIRSIIHFRPNFNQNVDGFNSLRLAYAVYDEAGLINNLSKIDIKNKATFMRGASQFGCPIYCGTAKSFDSKDNDFEVLYEMAEERNLIRFPIYARKAMHGYIDYETGKSDEVGAQKFIDEKLYAPMKSDKIALAQLQQEYPSEPEHFWMRKSGGLLPLGIINEQIKAIKEDPKFNIRTKQHSLIEIGDLKWKNGFGAEVEWVPNPKGKIRILKHPPVDSGNEQVVYKNLFVGGVDPYDKVDTVETDSKGACYIYERFNGIGEQCELPVLEYVDRPTNIEFEAGQRFVEKDIFYNNLYKIAKYYNCKLLVEDTDTQLFSRFKEWKADFKVLAPMPASEVSMRTQQKNKYGIVPTEGVKATITDYLDTYLKQHPESVLFLNLLNDMRRWGAANTDMVMAFGYCLIYDAELNSRRIVAKKDDKVGQIAKPFGSQWIRRNGKLVCVSDDNYFFGKNALASQRQSNGQ